MKLIGLACNPKELSTRKLRSWMRHFKREMHVVLNRMHTDIHKKHLSDAHSLAEATALYILLRDEDNRRRSKGLK